MVNYNTFTPLVSFFIVTGYCQTIITINTLCQHYCSWRASPNVTQGIKMFLHYPCTSTSRSLIDGSSTVVANNFDLWLDTLISSGNFDFFSIAGLKNELALELISMYELVYCFWLIVVARVVTEGLTMSTRLGEVKRMRTETTSCLTSQYEVGRKSDKHTNLTLLEDWYCDAVLPFINCSRRSECSATWCIKNSISLTKFRSRTSSNYNFVSLIIEPIELSRKVWYLFDWWSWKLTYDINFDKREAYLERRKSEQ